MKEHILLPVNLNPPIVSYNYLGILGSVLLVDDAYFPFYLSNYINYFSSQDVPVAVTNDIWFNDPNIFEYSEYKNNYYPPELSQEMMLDMISKGFYANLQVDEFFIPHRHAFERTHFIHDINVNGYDTKEKMFFTIGYDDTGKYCTDKVPFENLSIGISNVANHSSSFFFRVGNPTPKNFRVQNVILRLEQFINSKNSFTWEMKESLFGLECLYQFKEITQSRVQSKESIDIRAFRLIMERNALMLQRIQYIFSSGHTEFERLLIEYKEIHSKSAILFSLALKYDVACGVETGMRIVDRFGSLLELELDFSKRLYRYLSEM